MLQKKEQDWRYYTKGFSAEEKLIKIRQSLCLSPKSLKECPEKFLNFISKIHTQIHAHIPGLLQREAARNDINVHINIRGKMPGTKDAMFIQITVHVQIIFRCECVQTIPWHIHTSDNTP
jgi:hypothetical protein